MSRWIVKHKEGWCAAKPNAKWDESSFNIPTECDHFIVLPIGCAFGMPTCVECQEKLLQKARHG